jgi:ketosteroid isomerase-like protein
MKKFVLVGAIVASVFSASAQQTAGKMFSGKDAGKGFQLGSEKNSQIILDFVKAYNAQDEEKQLSFYTPELAKKRAEMTKKSIAYIKKVNDEPTAILPIKVAGSTDEIVMLQSVEYREAKNGSKETLDLFELFKINKEGKISDFSQYASIPKTNEYGQTAGGKFYSADANNGRAFQFSNRGEVEMMEKFNKAYNALDIPATMEFFADKINITDFDGNKIVLEKKDIPAIFADFKSLDWKITAILPFKIAYTDPASAIMVSSTEKRVSKDGTVWERDIVEYFYFNNAGKISAIDQYSRPKK